MAFRKKVTSVFKPSLAQILTMNKSILQSCSITYSFSKLETSAQKYTIVNMSFIKFHKNI